MINKRQLTDLVEDTLEELQMKSTNAVNLVLETIAQESALGTYLKQLGTGPAKGISQMEPFTHKDYWLNYIRFKPELVKYLLSITSTRVEIKGVTMPSANELVWNLKYAIAMCRVFYRRKPGVIPTTVEGRAAYWKKHYNTHLGAGTIEEYIKNEQKYLK